MTHAPPGIDRIRDLALHAERRIRLDRAVRLGAKALCVALVVAVVEVALRKTQLLGERSARVLLGLDVLGVVVAFVVAWTWRLPARAGARALDRHYDLHDRLASALAFAEEPEASRTAFMAAAIEDASSRATGLHPSRAVRLHAPRALVAAAGLAGLLSAVMLFEVRQHVPVAHAKTIEPVEMAPDDLDDVKDFLKQLQQRDPSDDTKAAIEEFNKLVDDIAQKRLDRTEAFRRMEQLEQKLLTGSEADKQALEQELDRIGEELKKAELTKPAGEAMSEAKLDQARDAMHDLAKQLREGGDKVDKQKLEAMRAALKAAAADAEKRQQAIEQRRQELADDILKRKQKSPDGGGSEEEQSLLKKKERDLERLDREMEQQKEAGRQLDRLDRELEKAAEDLMKDLDLSAQDLDQGAEDLNHIQQQEMTQEQKEELRQKIEEMRQLMRQQGQGGKGQIVRLQRFGRMARGQGGQGQQGQGQGQQGQDGQEGQDGQGQQGQQGKDGQQGQGGQQGPGGQQGQGQGGQGGETWVLGPNGEKLLMLSKGSGGGGGSQSGQGGQGQGQPGKGWGGGHDGNVQGRGTNPKMGTQDTQVAGADTGQGGSRSQVILGAAERGFASRGYQKVYTEYHQVAEESLAKDDIPGGYRFYVKRYFQLIRPRE